MYRLNGTSCRCQTTIVSGVTLRKSKRQTHHYRWQQRRRRVPQSVYVGRSLKVDDNRGRNPFTLRFFFWFSQGQWLSSGISTTYPQRTTDWWIKCVGLLHHSRQQVYTLLLHNEKNYIRIVYVGSELHYTSTHTYHTPHICTHTSIHLRLWYCIRNCEQEFLRPIYDKYRTSFARWLSCSLLIRFKEKKVSFVFESVIVEWEEWWWWQN